MKMSRQIAVFVSGGVFALVVMLSCGDRSAPIADATPADTAAQDAAPEGCCSNISISGVTKTMSADTDAAQLRSGSITMSSTPLVRGPIVLTHLSFKFEPATSSLTLSISPACGNQPTGDIIATIPASAPRELTGRIWIPAGSSLCNAGGGNSGTLFYSGFVPY